MNLKESKRLTLRYASVIFYIQVLHAETFADKRRLRSSSTKEKSGAQNKMADVISLDDKLELAKNKKAELIRRRKVIAVQKVFQCTQCAFKCEKCGIQISHNYQAGKKDKKNLRVPYRFCDAALKSISII